MLHPLELELAIDIDIAIAIGEATRGCVAHLVLFRFFHSQP